MKSKRPMSRMHRGDIARDVDATGEKMRIERERMDMAADDNDVVTETRDRLNLDITEEGVQEVNIHLEDALGGAEREFREHDDSLEHLQQDAAEQSEALEARERAGEDGREKLDSARLRTELRDVTSHLDRASESMKREVEFLRSSTERLKRIEEEFARTQASLRARMQGGGDS